LLEAYPPDASEQLWLEDSNSHLFLPHSAPRFLFRGECGTFPKTEASIYRAETYSQLSGKDLRRFEHLSNWLFDLFMKLADYSLSPMEALGVQQHYGMPTALIDFTANPAVAVEFAVCAGEQGTGRVCIMPTASFTRGLFMSNLIEHKWVRRPQYQSAFAIATSNGTRMDFKADYAHGDLAVRWCEFPITEEDRRIAYPRYAELIDLSQDSTAGILRHHIIEYAERFGKFSSAMARWLVNRVPMVPRGFRVLGFSEGYAHTDHVPPCELGSFDEEYERKQTERYLSEEFPDNSRGRVENWRIPPVGGIVADPRTLHSPLT
jgi:hypothetical protein